MPSNSRQMIRSLSVLASVATVMLCSLIEVVAADDDPLLQLKVFGDPTAGVQYVWALRRSEIEAAPYWDPLKGEAPLSPHQAVVAAQKYLKERYGPSLHLTSPTLMWLSKPADWNRGVERYHGNSMPDLWVYDHPICVGLTPTQHNRLS